MATTNSESRNNQMAADQALADGLTQNATKIGTLTVGSQPYQAADVAKVLQARITAQKAVIAAEGTLHGAVAAAKTQLASSRALIKAVKQALRIMFSNDVTTLATLGLEPNKEPAPTAATKAAAQVKAKATRTARGTKGKKQALAIKAPEAAQAAPVAETPAPAPAVATPVAPVAPASPVTKQ
jgi:hypothetical protein